MAYRFFATPQRRFRVADTPGHAQYTRNMATGASTASLAVLLVDARKGMQVQTRRHSRIVAMMGIRHAVLAVNKMDLVGFDQATFDAIVAEAQTLATELGFASLQAIPLSALLGDNVMLPSAHMPWYTGPTLLDYLNTVDTSSSRFGYRCSGSIARSRTSGGFVARLLQAPCSPVMLCACCPQA